jgi:hypothetical protein
MKNFGVNGIGSPTGRETVILSSRAAKQDSSIQVRPDARQIPLKGPDSGLEYHRICYMGQLNPLGLHKPDYQKLSEESGNPDFLKRSQFIPTILWAGALFRIGSKELIVDSKT